MRASLLYPVLGAALLFAPLAGAQTPGVTAACKDGTNFSSTTRTGACKGHGGVATWTTPAAAPGAPGIAPAAAPLTHTATAAPAAPPASIPNRTSTAPGSSTVAAAKPGAPGQVWVNTATKIYHCPGDRYYGKTKAGTFMPQAAAEAAGDHPSGGKACAS